MGAPVNARVRTSTGIEIGSAYCAPPPRPGRCAEEIQAALLPPPVERRPTPAERIYGALLATVMGVCLAAALVHWWAS